MDGEVRGGGEWRTFMFRGKRQGVLTPEERKGVRVDADYIGGRQWSRDMKSNQPQ